MPLYISGIFWKQVIDLSSHTGRRAFEWAGWLGAIATILLWIVTRQSSAHLVSILLLCMFSAGCLLIWRNAPRRYTSLLHRVITAMTLISVIALLVASSVRSDSRIILGFFGTYWFVYICIIALQTLGLAVCARFMTARVPPDYFTQQRLQRFYVVCLVSLMTAAILGFGILLPIAFSTRNALALGWVGLVLPAAFAVTTANLLPQMGGLPRREFAIAVCIIALLAGLVLNLSSVRDFPLFMNTDEPWTVNFADSIENTGYIFASMIPDGRMPALSSPRIYVLTNLWMSLWQHDVFAARTFSMLAGILLLVVIFFIANTIFDKNTAWAAVLLMALNLLWLAVSHVARPEMWFSLVVWLGLGLLFYARKHDRPPIAFFAGLLITLSAEVHLNGIFVCIAIAAWLLLDIRRLRREGKLILLLCAGTLVGTIIFVSYHILQSPQQFMNEISGEGRNSSGAFLEAAIRRHRPYFYANPIELLLLAGASAWAVIKSRAVHYLAVLLLFFLLIYEFFVRSHNMYYPMLWLPGFILLAAWAVRTMMPRVRNVFFLLCLATFIINVNLVTQFQNEAWNAQITTVLDDVAAHVMPTGSVLARPMFYFAFRDPRFIAYSYVMREVKRTNLTDYEVVAEIAPTTIISGPQDAPYSPQVDWLSYEHYMHVPFSEEQLSLNYQLQEIVQTGYGPFEIWIKQ